MKITKMYLFALGAVLALNACKDDDLTAPSISLIGNNPIFNASNYVDAGATATDDVDGDITSKIIVSGLPNDNIPGKYEVQYNVSDEAGNSAATVTRNVVTSVAGTYGVVEDCEGADFTYDISSSDSSNTSNYYVNFLNFGDVFSDDQVYGTIVGNVITIPLQTPIQGSLFNVFGSGTISVNSSINVVMNIEYTIETDGGTTDCTFTGTQK